MFAQSIQMIHSIKTLCLGLLLTLFSCVLVPTLQGQEYNNNPIPNSCSVVVTIDKAFEVNVDDDNETDEWDKDEVPSPEDDDLIAVTITGTAGKTDGTMSLTWTGGEFFGDKLWLDPQKEDPAEVFTWSIPAGQTQSITYYIEGVLHSEDMKDVIMLGAISCPGFENILPAAAVGIAESTVFEVDMDADTFNDLGEYTESEDKKEFSKDASIRGVYVYKTEGDINNNGVQDEVDFDAFAELRLVDLEVELKGPFDPASAMVTFEYTASDPANNIREDEKAVTADGLRIWRQKRSNGHSVQPVPAGDFIAPGTEIPWASIAGANKTANLFVEYVGQEDEKHDPRKVPIKVTVTQDEATASDQLNTYVRYSYPNEDKGGENWSEMSGWRFRRLALNGMPLSASKGQAKAESDEETEETYIDSLNMHLRHDTTDVYIPSLGGQMALTVKRSIAPTIWGDGESAKLSDRSPFAFPFGAGWNSSITPHIRFENTIINFPSESGHLYPGSYVYVTDGNGASYRFAQIFIDNDAGQKAFLPLPSNRTDKDVFASQLKLENGMYVFTRKFGTQLNFQTAAEYTDEDNISITRKKVTTYHRIISIEDRLKNTITYEFNQSGLIPSKITAKNGTGGLPRELVITQKTTNKFKHVESVTDPIGNKWEYIYDQEDYGGDIFPVLKEVISPAGSITKYNYETETASNLISKFTSGATTEYYHVNVNEIRSNILSSQSSIKDADNNTSIAWGTDKESVTSFSYGWDNTVQAFDVTSQQYYNPSANRPRVITSTSLPEGGSASFAFTGAPVYLDIDEEPTEEDEEAEVVVKGERKYQVTDAEGHVRTIHYSQEHLIDAQEIEKFLYPSESAERQDIKVIAWQKVEMTHPTEIAESATFKINANMADDVVIDYSGNVTSYKYEDSYEIEDFYPDLDFLADNLLFSPFYSEPTEENRSGLITKYAYKEDTTQKNPTDKFRIMQKVTDPEGRVTTYGIDPITALRTSETVKSSSGQTIKHSTMEYANSQFPGFMTKSTLKDATINNGVLSDLVTEFSPDTYGNVAASTVDSTGLNITTSSIYDANGNKISSTDALNNTTLFEYDAQNRLASTTAPDAGQGVAKTTFGYDPNSNKIWTKDALGNVTYSYYDKLNRSTKVQRVMTDSANYGSIASSDIVSSQTYSQLNRVLESTDPRGVVTQTTYDAIQRATTVTVDPTGENLVTQLSYDGDNAGSSAFNVSGFKPTKSIDPRGFETLVTYDELYRPIKTRKQYQLSPALYTLSEVDYDNVGNVIESRSYRNEGGTAKVTKTTYDGLNRPVSVTDAYGTPLAVTTTTDYTSSVAYRSTDPLGRVSETDYDKAGRAIKAWSPDPTSGAVNRATPNDMVLGSPMVETTYDANSNVIQVKNPRGYITTSAYDARNRPVSVTLPGVLDYGDPANPQLDVSAVSTTTYDNIGNVIAVTDARGNITRTFYDKAYRPIATSSNPSTGAPAADYLAPSTYDIVTLTDYDQNSNPVAVRDGNGNWTRNEYDNLNRLTATVTNPLDGNPSADFTQPKANDILVSNTYDKGNNLTTVTDGEGAVTGFSYDGLGRKLTTIWDRGSYVERVEETEYDGLLVTATINPKGERIEQSYDERYRPTLTEHIGRGQDNTLNTYDIVGNVLSITYPSASADTQVRRSVAMTYDALNRGITETSNGVTHTHTYDKANNLLTKTYGQTGRQTVSSYDALNRLLGCTENGADNVLRSTLYYYDLNSNITLLDRANGTRCVKTYDALNRSSTIVEEDSMSNLISSFDYSVPVSTYSSGYDNVGNVIAFRERYGNATNSVKDRNVLNTYDKNYRLSVELIYEAAFGYYSGSEVTGYRSTSSSYSYDNANNRSKWKQYVIEEQFRQSDILNDPNPVVQKVDFNSLYIPVDHRNTTYKSIYTYPPEPDSYLVERTSKKTNWVSGYKKEESYEALYTYDYNQLHYNSNQLVAVNTTKGTASLLSPSSNEDHISTQSSGNQIDYVYDLNGNRATRSESGNTDTYHYDYSNRLVQLGYNTDSDANKNGTYNYEYDHRTRRVLRDESAANGDTTRVVFSDGLSVQEHDQLGTGSWDLTAPAVEYVRGSSYGGGIGGVLYTVRNGVPSFNAYNSRGDVVSKTNASGSTTWQASYEAFGTRTQEEGSDQERQRANTKDEDPTGLLNEGMRYRDLEAGVFITRDPAGFVDGPNVYTYVTQNPWTYYDPYGLYSMAEFNQNLRNIGGGMWNATGQIMNTTVHTYAKATVVVEGGAKLVAHKMGMDVDFSSTYQRGKAIEKSERTFSSNVKADTANLTRANVNSVEYITADVVTQNVEYFIGGKKALTEGISNAPKLLATARKMADNTSEVVAGFVKKVRNFSVQKKSKKVAKEETRHAHGGKPKPTPPGLSGSQMKKRVKKQNQPESHPDSSHPEKHFHRSDKDIHKERKKSNVHVTYPKKQ